MSSNTTETASVSSEDLSVITFADAILCFVGFCLAAFLTSANATTVVAIWRTPALWTLANAYVCSLACTDFVVGLICVLMALFALPPVRLDLFYRYINVCALFQGVVIGMSLLSAIHMSLIAIDRYLYIIKPYFYQRVINIRVISFFIAIAWVIGLIIAFLPQFITKPYGPVPVCDITERQPVWYTFYTVAVLYSSLCIVNVIMYSIILHAAGKQRKAVRANVPLNRIQGKNAGPEGNTKALVMYRVQGPQNVFFRRAIYDTAIVQLGPDEGAVEL
ncbi:beta-1 adrenergic receptor [Plakobranchus ocellatus]|uniref:Beta-1 adrenergic receptor n=1 Tax=Plakobranchus ocellatus TaxID=259542 RepID=A0AAV3YZE6_9GAST|nr:beta-1 adrenergic receptor [Plakobranchus ocellatus]